MLRIGVEGSKIYFVAWAQCWIFAPAGKYEGFRMGV